MLQICHRVSPPFCGLIVAVAKGTLRALGPVPAGVTDFVSVQYPGQMFKDPFDGLGHGNAESPRDTAQGAG
jgi:hypothetical protein